MTETTSKLKQEDFEIIDPLPQKEALPKRSVSKIKNEFFNTCNSCLIACFLSIIIISVLPAPLGFKILALFFSQAFIFDILHSYKFLIKNLNK